MRIHSLGKLTLGSIAILLSNITLATEGTAVYTGTNSALGDSVGVVKLTDLSNPTSIVAETKLDIEGLIVNKGPKVLSSGIHAGDKKITNVTDGEISATSHEAINGSQLHSELAKLGNSRGGILTY